MVWDEQCPFSSDHVEHLIDVRMDVFRERVP
jgi:hypothetical protein